MRAMKPTWCTNLSSVYSVTIPLHVLGLLDAHHQEVTLYICNNWYVLSVLIDVGSTVAVSLRPCHNQLALYARSIPNAVCVAPPQYEQVMVETCRGLDSQLAEWKVHQVGFITSIYRDARSTKHNRIFKFFKRPIRTICGGACLHSCTNLFHGSSTV
jgi:hypothetical protein